MQNDVTPAEAGVQMIYKTMKALDVLARFAHSASLRSPCWSLSR